MNPSLVLSLLLSLAVFACPGEQGGAQPQPARQPEAAAAQPAAAQPPQAPPSLVAARRQIMSTWWELKVEQQGREPEARAVLERALDEIARLEDVLSEWRPGTEISRINEAAGNGVAVPVGPDSFENLRVGMEVSRLSGGAFDLSWAAMRGLYRFEQGAEPRLPDPKLVARQRALVSYKDIVFDQAARTARLRRKGMALGTGGIAKGYALDRAAEILEQAGFTNYLLFAGGQVQVHGAREGRAWRVGIKHPRRLDKHIGFFEVYDGSIATAGDYEHAYEVEGRRIHHIIDPATGYPATRSVSVTLVAQSGIYADALDNACFIVGPARCIAMLAKLPDAPQAVIIDPELRVHMTPGIAGKVLFNPPLVDGRLSD
jgi:thiamine biosynthesis lipoprotein